MNVIFSCFALLISLTLSSPLAIPKQDSNAKRVHDNRLSEEEHYNENDLHNLDYDHEAFLGEGQAKYFSELSPEESKLRLGKIVEKIDTNKDGFVSQDELKNWIILTQKRYVIDDAERQWKGLNPNEEDEILWENYRMLTYGLTSDAISEDLTSYKEMIDRDLRRWNEADLDGSNSLSKQEFQDFLHPEESGHMKDIIVIETLEDMDKDNDGKVSLEEYIGDMVSDQDFDDEPSWIQSEKDQFVQFRDKDKSGFMEFDEIKQWILPNDYDYSESEAKHLIYESDINRDNLLSKEEILNNYDLFVGSQATEFGEALKRHDEF